MSDFGSDGALRRRRRLKVPGRDAWFTWVGDEDPTEEDMKAMTALIDAAIEDDRKRAEAPAQDPKTLTGKLHK